MQDFEAFSALVGRIYDTAIEPDRWSELVTDVARFVGWFESVYCLHRPEGSPVEVHSTLDRGHIDAYLEEYATLDPLTPNTTHADVGSIIVRSHIIPSTEFAATRFHREWNSSAGIADAVHIVIDRSPEHMAVLGVAQAKTDEPINAEILNRLQLLMPHFRRAALVAGAIDFTKVKISAFAETLDRLNSAMLLVDDQGRVVHTNVAGNIMLGRGDLVYLNSDKLFARDLRANRALWDIFAALPNGDASLVGKPLDVALAAGGDRYVAHVLPIAGHGRHVIGRRHRASAAIFLRKGGFRTPSRLEALARSFDLTPMEVTVVLTIVAQGGAPEAAEALGVAPTTIKTHLTRIYGKTGVKRHADLAKLVAAFVSPFGPPDI